YGVGAIGFLQGAVLAGRQLPGVDFFVVVGVIALALGFLGMYCIYAGVRQLRARLEVSRRGLTVEGRVTGRRFDRRSKWWMVTYNYDCLGKAYSHEQAVRKKVYLALDEGAGVFVRCLARDPKVAR